MRRALPLVLPLALGLTAGPSLSQQAPGAACAKATAEQPLLEGQPALSPGPALEGSKGTAEPAEGATDYRQRLRTTPLGWARLNHWCVWVAPPAVSGPAALWDGRWHRAVLAALSTWSLLVPITLVEAPERAQVWIERRRPPLQEVQGRLRASHGRSLLRLLRVQRGGFWRPEPRVLVLIGPSQAEPALQATALHELGHAFGLWGHSDQAGDAMAAVPGPRPVLALSDRDRRTVRWLYGQTTRFGGIEPDPVGSRQ